MERLETFYSSLCKERDNLPPKHFSRVFKILKCVINAGDANYTIVKIMIQYLFF